MSAPRDVLVLVDGKHWREPLKPTAEAKVDTRSLAQSLIDRADEDWTYIDPEDVKRLARAVLEHD